MDLLKKVIEVAPALHPPQDVSVHNTSSKSIHVAISGHGNNNYFTIPPGGVETWGRKACPSESLSMTYKFDEGGNPVTKAMPFGVPLGRGRTFYFVNDQVQDHL